MRKFNSKRLHLPLILWLLISAFILFYPMLISIYVFLPVLIGLMGYLLILGIHKNHSSYIFISVLYLLNLEINLSLPFFLTIISALLVYILFYRPMLHFKGCDVCKSIVTVLILDFFYLGLLLAYDFMFQSTTIVLDDILFYSLVTDLLIAVML